MHYVKESRIAAPPERVFAWHAMPGTLARLTPPWERVEILEGGDSLQPGSRVRLRARVGPIWIRWIAEHVEYDPPRRFSDKQIGGPFALWHHDHWFLDDGAGGTIVRDEVEFQPPMGGLGRLLLGAWIRRKLERLFTFRHEVTRRACEEIAP